MKSNKLVFAAAVAGAVVMAACGKEEAPPPVTTAPPPPPVAAVEPPPSAPLEQPAAGQPAADDVALADRVRSALQSDPDVGPLAIDVSANQGVVQLSGFVESSSQTDKASSIASGVEGVRSVDNRLESKVGAAPAATPPRAGIDDAAITSQIKSALMNDPYMNNFDVAVVTRNGEVQLSGYVANQEQADDVLAIAHKTDGVKKVISTLSVGQEKQAAE